MAHYAKVVDGKVINVITAEAEFFDTFVDTEPGDWIQTSYNTYGNQHYGYDSNGNYVVDGGTPLRGNFAGVGYTYDSTHDAFYTEKPDASWTLNTSTFLWDPPFAAPDDGKKYYWDESLYQSDNTKGWVEITKEYAILEEKFMANVACWYQTQLPTKMIDILIDDIEHLKPEDFLIKSNVIGVSDQSEGSLNENIRKSKHAWIPSAHWIGGFLWHYVDRINQENFLYNISGYDENSIQYTQYTKDNYYKWHADQDIGDIQISNERVRKLSFTLQLSSGNDYTGGDVEFKNIDGSSFLAPRNRGCMIVFDSRVGHRVCEITSGTRKSLVGWIVGPRWM